jgi:uncharacterized protein YndB with AHSA1/START domain
MPPAGPTAERSTFEIDEAAHTIRFTRHVSAPAGEVFRSWTEPEQVASWWDPSGEPLLSCDIDLRAGGRFAFVSRSHSDMPFEGTYRAIEPPARLVFEAMGAEGRVTLAAAADGTLMTVEIVCASAEHLAGFVAMGAADGTGRTLDNLVARLGPKEAQPAE